MIDTLKYVTLLFKNTDFKKLPNLSFFVQVSTVDEKFQSENTLDQLASLQV